VVLQDDNTLNELTKDLLLRRRSFAEISQQYSPAVTQAGFRPINNVNLCNHRRHSDPALLAKQLMEERNVPVTPADSAKQFYEHRFAEEIKRISLMDVGYKARLQGLEDLQGILEERKRELQGYQEILQRDPNDAVARSKHDKLEQLVFEMTVRVLAEQRYIQDTLLKHEHLVQENTSGTSSQQVADAVVRETKQGSVEFLRAFKAYLMTDVFVDNPDRARVVLHYMTSLLVQKMLEPLQAVLTPTALRRQKRANTPVLPDDPPRTIGPGAPHG
jgi:hypothetical protein